MKSLSPTKAVASVLLLAGAFSLPAQDALAAAARSGANSTLLRLSPAAKKPVIDGVMKEGEWSGTSHQFGGISDRNGSLALRWADFWFGYDDENIYFAQRSVLPKKPMKLSDRNEAEIQLRFPGSPVRTVSFNPKGEGKLPEGTKIANRQEGKFWISEVAIPLKSLGIMAIPYGKECKLQMIRHYSNPDDAAEWHPSSKQVPYGVWIPEKEIPLISFQTLWTHRANPTLSHRPTCKIKNRTSHPARIAGAIRVDSVKAPALETITMLTVKPGAGENPVRN